MRFAILDAKLIESSPGLKAVCPGCSQPVVAKCGTQRIHHWAHVQKMCDSWSEPETQWHRAWKNHFPVEWQEIFLPDQRTGEKHIADVRTSHGMVIEFQHSHLDPQERSTREAFYRNMVWVVDGNRLKRDYPRFLKGKSECGSINSGIYRTMFPDECFPAAWIKSPVPVLFDFSTSESIGDIKDPRNDLILLFPSRIGGDAIFAVLSRKAFIDAATNGKLIPWTYNYIQELKNLIAERQRQQDNINFNQFMRTVRYRKSRRF